MKFFFKDWTPSIEDCALRMIMKIKFQDEADIENDKKILKRLLSRINWSKLFTMVAVNKLQFIIFDTLLNPSLSESIPKDILKKLEKEKIIFEYYRKKQRQEFLSIIKAFTRNGVDFVVMKTFLVAETLFDKRFEKINNDLDLLIPLADFKRAATCLFKLKYFYLPDSNKKNEIQNSIKSFDFYLPKSQELFVKNSNRVELHTTIVDTSPFPEVGINENTNRLISQELFSKAEIITKRNLQIKIFTPTWLLFSLFLHSFFQHNLQGAMSYYEMASIIRKYRNKIDWSSLLITAKHFQMSRYFIWFLKLLENLYPKLLPQKITLLIKSENNSLDWQHKLTFLFMKNKIFFPTKFHTLRSEKQKEWLWAIISNKLFKILGQKLKRRLLLLTNGN